MCTSLLDHTILISLVWVIVVTILPVFTLDSVLFTLGDCIGYIHHG